MSQKFDDLVTSTEHAEPVHPLKVLWRENFYLGDLVSTEGGLSLLLMDALLLVPLIMAAFFYPLAALIFAAGVAVVTFAAYEGYVIWSRHYHA